MIISHRYRFIFFAIPKTGTHSIRKALRAHLGEHDLEQVALFENRRFPFPELARLGHGHISAQQIQPVLGEQMFREYFKFAFVRNPFDRFVSYCAFISRHSGQFRQSPSTFMKYVLTEMKPTDHLLYRPQWEFIGDSQQHLLMDFTGRTEQLQEGYDRICEHLHIPSTRLERSNESNHGDYRDYYDDELTQLVSGLYSEDLAQFGYAFDNPRT